MKFAWSLYKYTYRSMYMGITKCLTKLKIVEFTNIQMTHQLPRDNQQD